MNKFKSLLSFMLLSLLLFSVQGCSKYKPNPNQPKAVNGILDLSKYKASNIIKLDGEWERYQHKLYTSSEISKLAETNKNFAYIPGTWNNEGNSAFGYCTYRLILKYPFKKDKLYAIKTDSMATAFEIDINGKTIIHNGTVGKNRKDSIPQYLPKFSIFRTLNEEIEIVLKVSNFHHRLGGPWKSIVIAEADTINKETRKDSLIEMFLIATLIVMGIYHLLHFMLRTNQKTYLYFGLFCIIVAIKSLLTGQRFFIEMFPHFSWEIANKIDYISLYLGVPVFIAFLHSLYPKDSKKIILKSIWVIEIIATIITIFTPVRYFSHLARPFQGVIILIAPYVTYILVKALLRKRNGAVLFLSAWIFFFITIVNDILYTNHIINTGILAHLGFFVFILSQSFMLSQLFAIAMKSIEDMSKYLENLNITYRKFVPEELLKHLRKDSILELKLGDQTELDMTILFCDIRGFSALSETMTSKEIFSFLNSILKIFGPIVRKNNGFIDKFIGDEIMALFEKSPCDAINTAISIHKELAQYNQWREIGGNPPITVGVGIHTGNIILGTIGENERMEGTVISDTVNSASRLEGLTKIFDAPIIISKEVADCPNVTSLFNKRHLGKINVKGKNKTLDVYEILEGYETANLILKRETSEQFEKAITLYEMKEFKKSKELFNEVLDKNPKDTAAYIYYQQCSEYQKIVNIEDWDGSIRMNSKR